MFRSFDPDDPLTANGLNQLTQYATKTVSHDDNGNVSGFGTDSYTYSNENLLTTATVGGTTTNLSYDPLLRLYETSSGGTARYAYDGLNALAEYDGSGALQQRWVFDPTTGQPVIWYDGGGSAAKRYLGADERGSIISVSDPNGASLGINTYDEYGMPAAGNLGRYGYTGQAWLGPAKLWHLNARMYSPMIDGRFIQPDPIGYAGGMNLYAYVGGDPVNFVDPLGTIWVLVSCQRISAPTPNTTGGNVIVTAPSYVCSYRWQDIAPSRRPGVTDPFDRKLGIETGKGGNLHRYELNVVTQCSAASAFEAVRGAGNSAPGAPYARSGAHDLVLTGNNPITQTVDPGRRTITNVTRPPHMFDPGTVEIRVKDLGRGYSSINITGTGSGANAGFNELVGALIFGGMAYAIEDYCAAKNGTQNLKN